MNFYLFLILPLAARAIIFAKKRKEMGFWPPGWLIGISQDISVTLFFLGLYLLRVPFFIIAFFLIYHLIDAFLLAAADFRMRLSFTRYLFEFKDFQSSAVDMGIRPLLILLSLIYLGICYLSWLIPLGTPFPYILLPLAIAGGSVEIFYKGKMYLYSNPLFHEALDKLIPLLEKVKDKEPLSVLPAQCEKAKYLTPHYPLLKMTEGFIGEKTFHIQVEKNEKPHVILIVLESFGFKYLHNYEATPNLDALADKGILFTDFHAAGIPTSRASLATLFGIHPDLDPFSLQERNPLYPLIGIQDIVKGEGYHTVYHTGGSLLFLNANKYLKNHGFIELSGDEQILSKGSRTSWGVHDKELFDFSFKRLDQLDKEDKPTFMMISTVSNHHPWQVPEEYEAPEFKTDSPLLSRYLQTVCYTDAALGNFINHLKTSGISKNTLLIVTADNGQPMGEHEGNYMPLKEVYEENHRIPLILFFEGRISTPTIIDQIGSQVDLMPTIMDILSLQGVNHSIGTSLMRQAPERHAFCVNTHILPYISHNFNQYKYTIRLDTDERQLFDLKKDPKETKNVIESHPKEAELLHTQLMNHFTSLQRLYTENRITPATDRSIVLLGDQNVTDQTLLEEAKKHKSLNSILISECPEITDKGFCQAIEKVDQLEFLYLNILHLSDLSLKPLMGKTKQLKEFTLSHIQSISSEALIKILKHSPNLEELTLSGNVQVQDEVIQTLVDYCPNLQNLELPECFGLTSEGIEILSKGCPNLNRLNLQGLPFLTDQTLIKLSSGSYDLLAFHMLNCPEITGKGLWSLCEKNPQLQRLSFTGENIDDQTIKKITTHCPDIMKLLIHECPQLTSDGFLAIAKNLNKLVILELANCPNLTDLFFEKIANKPLDHLLIAGAPLISDKALPNLEKLSTLRTLYLYFCPKITKDTLIKTGEIMNKSGILHEITYDRTKQVFYHKNQLI